ncbi:hypothetical protein M409DRAFT_65870 [Zasmidium cellare ATCC 36951]|uniref:Uncharacterized protein n=1 Tax=Zasmidium cellare ATCC 36951 TaxID=1080233 RepID=A0A6A6CKJ4_ZASCE|nr:uncharacterized protein M409DRAFT_65870 [Zasmidium cellare ATCC 36951]KAF2167767.1 hypothetical protein M409DRAFT_65870 [Zasmidium cellare ATCC 36951]
MLQLRSYALALLASIATLSQVNAQCANNVAVYNPDVRTLTANNTWFVVPVPKAAALTAIQEAYPLLNVALLDVPNDPTLFPNGFPAGQQPAIVNIGLSDDIRMSAFQIDGGLKVGQVYISYVSLNGSPSPLQAQTSGYIAGETGPLPNGLVPALASTLLFGGNPTRLGEFTPDAAPYQSEGGPILSAQTKWALLPNPISGPGIYPEAFDFEFTTIASSASRYTAKGFKYLINLPTLLPTAQCQRNAYYFTNATANPVFRNGNVTFGPGADGSSATSSALMAASADGSGIFADVDGYGGCAQSVGNSVQGCDEASAHTDPNTLN